jgi:membrane protein DedA with SNARE-associated domain
MPRLRFHIYTSLGSLTWYLCLAYAGMKLGEKWHTDPRIEQVFHRFHLVVEIAIVAAVIWFVGSHLHRGRQPDTA